MNAARIPWYQALISSLPYRNRVSRAIGILRRGRMRAVVNKATYRLDLREAIQRQMFLGSYEPIETMWFKRCVGTGDTFIDVGANFGHYTTLGASLVGAMGKVFAFEPSPLASEVLEEMIEASGIENVLLTRAAVGNSNGSVELFMPTTDYLHSPSIMASDPDFVPLQVPVIALDTFEPLTNVATIKLVKIDVEGYEPDVLDGMEHLIRTRRVLNIFCEFNSWWLERNSTTPSHLLERFLDYGYEISERTALQQGLTGHKGAVFNLQDIWFKLPGG
jgi:FkbM family methyltransferase